ncbi:MAG: prephenate/arogenate dehydrogenase family protein [Methyloligellaceae bacterium]
METPMFKKLALIGLGMIGSSISHIVRKNNIVESISGAAKSEKTRDISLELGLVDEVYSDPAEAVVGADLVILCVPVGANESIAERIAPNLTDGAILTDVGSVKRDVINLIKPHVPPGVHFIPGHPIAGTEQSGPEAGFAELFQGRWCILTPEESVDAESVENLKKFWMACGSYVDIMDARHHDLVLAITSHLPHLIAYNIVGTADDLETVTQSEVIKYSAGGFRDFTRLAASDPVMWRDVCLHNKDAILEMLGRFSEDLASLQRAVRWSDGDALFELFTRTRNVRKTIIEAGQDISRPDFGRHNSRK